MPKHHIPHRDGFRKTRSRSPIAHVHEAKNLPFCKYPMLASTKDARNDEQADAPAEKMTSAIYSFQLK
jgi:hypothetical protein